MYSYDKGSYIFKSFIFCLSCMIVFEDMSCEFSFLHTVYGRENPFNIVLQILFFSRVMFNPSYVYINQPIVVVIPEFYCG